MQFYTFLFAALQMFLRILEMKSGMKWNVCGLLLISALFCISAKNHFKKWCKDKPRKPTCAIFNSMSSTGNGNDMEGIFILGTDGFMGYMKTGDSNGNVKY